MKPSFIFPARAALILWIGILLLVGCSNSPIPQGQTTIPAPSTNHEANDGMPYGMITDADAENLRQFAAKHGFDLETEMAKVYAQDSEALARLLRLSLVFTTFDQNARTYGQVLYSCFLNMGEVKNWNFFPALVAQEPNVQQRIRDYLNYPLLRLSKKDRALAVKQIQRDYPLLYPAQYRFGRNDPLFDQDH